MLFYSVLSNNVPEERRLAVAELLTRANYGMLLGNWEMDFSDGEIRYKTSAFVGDGVPDKDLAASLVFANVFTVDRYLPAVLGVTFGSAEPAAIIAEVEGE